MPKMPQKTKREWSVFLDPRGRHSYNELCRRCIHPCKQSYRALVIECRRYYSKRAVQNYEDL